MGLEQFVKGRKKSAYQTKIYPLDFNCSKQHDARFVRASLQVLKSKGCLYFVGKLDFSCPDNV